MKFYKTKLSTFLLGKGFYLVLAVCMAAMGMAVYSALDAIDPVSPQENSSIQESVPEELESFPVEEEEEKQEIEEEKPLPKESEPVENEGVATFFMLPLNGEIIKHFDNEHLQYSATYNDMRLHTGTDIKPESTKDVISAGDGSVLSVEENTVLGNVVTIDHGNTVTIRYCGVEGITVSAGDTVFAGQVIGQVGTVTNECNDEEHIHIEVFKSSKPVNPAEFFDLQ